MNSRSDHGYRAIGRKQRTWIAQAFAAKNKVVYGQAFDLIRVPNRTTRVLHRPTE